jgi:hypothetical protein
MTLKNIYFFYSSDIIDNSIGIELSFWHQLLYPNNSWLMTALAISLCLIPCSFVEAFHGAFCVPSLSPRSFSSKKFVTLCSLSS